MIPTNFNGHHTNAVPKVTSTIYINYFVMATTYIFFYRAVTAQGVDRKTLPYYGWFQPYSAYVACAWFFVLTFLYGYTSLKYWNGLAFLGAYFMVLLSPVLFVGWKIIKKTKFISPMEADLVWEVLFLAVAEKFSFSLLAEEDVFYGLWRRRSLYPETNAGIALEQAGMWEQASNMYEYAQVRTRSGALPYSESEFCLWEDHWILAQEKLQQWDILFELGKQEQNIRLSVCVSRL